MIQLFRGEQRATAIVLALILVLAAGLRFYGLTERGIFDYDEAWYLLEAKSLYDAGEYMLAKISGDELGNVALKDYLKVRGDTPITSFKPGHTVLVFLGLLAFGLNDYASFAMSAILGTLTVWIVYLLGSKMFGRRAGLLAALILAVSAFHVSYSRSGYAQAKSVFFVALGVYLWYTSTRSSSRQKLFPAGLAIGYAFSCHFNLFTIPVVMVLVELLHQRQIQQPIVERARSLAILGSGMATPLVLFELPSRILAIIGKLPDGQLSYYEQYFYRGALTAKLHFSIDGAFALADKLWVSESGLAVIGLLIGFTVSLTRIRDIRYASMLALFFLPALPWSTMSVGLPPLYRTFSVLAVPFALLSASGLIALIDAIRFRNRRLSAFAFTAAAVILLGTGLSLTAGLLPLRSSYRETTDAWIDYVEKNGGVVSIMPGSSWPIWYFYLSARYNGLPEITRQHIQFYPGSTDPIPSEGDYDVVDIKRIGRAILCENTELQSYMSSLQNVHQVARMPNTAAALPDRFLEAWGPEFEGPLKQSYLNPDHAFTTVFDKRSRQSIGVTQNIQDEHLFASQHHIDESLP